MNRRSFLAGIGAALFLPEPKRVRAYSFLPGEPHQGTLAAVPILLAPREWPPVLTIRTAEEYRLLLGRDPDPAWFAPPKMIHVEVGFARRKEPGPFSIEAVFKALDRFSEPIGRMKRPT